MNKWFHDVVSIQHYVIAGGTWHILFKSGVHIHVYDNYSLPYFEVVNHCRVNQDVSICICN